MHQQQDKTLTKFSLTPEQRLALLNEKIARAEAQIKSLANIAKHLKQYNL